MRSGLNSEDWKQWSSPGFEGYMRQSEDFIKFMLDLSMIREPGSHFAYSSGGVIVLSGIVAKSAGMDIQSFADSVLYHPLGIEKVDWPKYAPYGSDATGELELLPRDMAKIGQLMLNKGTWKGNRIVSENWVMESTREHVNNPTNTTWGKGYAYLWWMHEVEVSGQRYNSYSASGNGGQVICIYPQHDLVVICTGGNYDSLDHGYPFAIIERFILPALIN
jgi:CubicO group peptidase (beta-lactamase class C family)